eukprot:TRINITY_DN75297_c0_g1_i1.p1 TRINITY_DN75297_c0_g1~~TRINITY_DN75297_c0_g1_i1.p1  ORF type:complete len:525 (+),score=149.25 TRINITY_DN75297_c0_g1_i1:84-1577(+)
MQRTAAVPPLPLLSVLLLSTLLPSAARAATEGGYRAAFVAEFAAEVLSTPEDTLWHNANETIRHAAAAAAAGADLFLAPEYGITGFHDATLGREAWLPYVVQIGDALLDTVLCDSSAPNTPALLSALSCAARQHGIAVVVDLAELFYNTTTHSNPPSPWEYMMFNTAVAFDSTGALVARARKFNLWNEPLFDPPTEQMCGEPSAFHIKPGHPARFGLFICADVVYAFPTSALLKQGVTDFVSPIAWSNEMPQTEALGFIQGWSQAHCTNIVMNNHRRVTESGSGVFSCGEVLASYYATGDSPPEARLMLTDVPQRNSRAVRPAVQSLRGGGGGEEVAVSDTSSWVLYPLTSTSMIRCTGTTCCNVTVEGNVTGYSMGLADGADAGGLAVWGVVACGIYYTPSNVMEYRRPVSAGIAAAVVVLTSEALPEALLLPNTILTREGETDSMVPPTLAQQQLDTKGDVSRMRLVAPKGHLVSSAAIYGRVFSRDHTRYNCTA